MSSVRLNDGIADDGNIESWHAVYTI